MPTLLPRDDDHQPIPALRLRPGGAHIVLARSVSARNAVPFDPSTRVISIYATAPVFVRSGDATVTASPSDHYLPGDFYYDISLGDGRRGGHTHIAVIRASADATVYISEKE